MSTTTNVWRPSSARRIALDGFTPVPRGTVPSLPAAMSWPAKDPSDVLDYEFDLAAAMAGNEGDRLDSVSVSITPNAPGDLTMNSSAVDGYRAVFWFAAGQPGVVYTVQITAVTMNGRTIGRSVLLPVLPLAAAVAPMLALNTNTGSVITDAAGNPILVAS